MPTDAPILEGVNFDHYQVLTRSDGSLHELGRGTMGITYKAFDTNLRVPVALKVINTQTLDSELARERFVQEARSAAKLRHPHVASVFHLGAEGDTYFYAMEFIDGETVEALVKRRGPLPPLVALRVCLQVARALAAAQQHALVHRDIKPANLMLISEEHELCAKLIDFGLALNARAEGAGDSTRSEAMTVGFVGTPHYASPEQLEVKEVDIRSDIYSLGATLWYMLAGETLFAGSVAKVMSSHLSEPPAFEKLKEVPEAIVALLRRMLAKQKEERPQSASELRREIEACLEKVTPTQAQANAEERGIAEETAQRGDDSPVSDFATRNVVAGHFEVIEQLGETNEGWVFQARDLTGAREVRLLVLRQDFSDLPEALTELEREVERLTRANHPHLLRVYGLETLRNLAVIVLEWTPGVTLRELLRRRRTLPAGEILPLLQQMAEGIDYAVSYDVRQLDLSLHQVFLHVPELADVPEALLQQPMTDWPKFSVKLNPLGITRELSMSETWAGAQTMVGAGENTATASMAGGTNLGPRYTRTLAGLVYELLGGATKPVLTAASGGVRYTPLSNLTEEGNEVMRRAFDPAGGFASAADLVKALLGVEQLESRHYEGAAGRSQGNRSALGLAVPKADAQPDPDATLDMSGRKSLWPALAGAVVLALAGAGLFLYVRPAHVVAPPVLQATPAPPTPLARLPEPAATPEPEPAAPDPRALLNAAAAEAERVEAQKDVGRSLQAWLAVAHEFPSAEIGRMRLELLLDGMRLRQEKLSPADLQRLTPPLEEAAGLGVASAMLLLAESHLKADPEAAFRWYAAAAAKGVPSALTQVGLMYSNGAGVARDLVKAVAYFEQGSEKGDPGAKAALAECLLYGRGVEKNPEQAIELLRQAVSKGNLLAMNRLATCYHQGLGVEKNFTEAVRLYEMAAAQHYAQAYGNLGVLYMKGEGVPQNPRKAVELFQKGAKEEDAFCMFLYAQSLEAGMGITANLGEARGWYKRAAEDGMPMAAEWCKRNHVAFGPETK